MARTFNTYGVPILSDDCRVLSNFTEHALREETVSFYGDGIQMCSFCFVDHLVDELVLLITGNYSGSINVCNPCEFMISHLAELMKARINYDVPAVEQPLTQDDPLQCQPLITLVERDWDGNPR